MNPNIEIFTDDVSSYVKNYLTWNNCPLEIIELISSNCILSGGTITKALAEMTKDFNNKIQESEYIQIMLSNISTLINYKHYENKSDYDLYTDFKPIKIYSYLTKYGYVFDDFSLKPSRKEIGIEEILERMNIKTTKGKAYSSRWIMSASKVYPDRHVVKVDVMFPMKRQYKKLPNIDSLEEFIIREFDIDICKVWYDGKNTYGEKGSLNAIYNKNMKFSFNAIYTINRHKRFTTASRVLKYRNRGFSFIEQDKDFNSWYLDFIRFSMKKIYDVNFIELRNHIRQMCLENYDSIMKECIKRRTIVEYADTNNRVFNIDSDRIDLSIYLDILYKYYNICLYHLKSLDSIKILTDEFIPIDIIDFMGGFLIGSYVGNIKNILSYELIITLLNMMRSKNMLLNSSSAAKIVKNLISDNTITFDQYSNIINLVKLLMVKRNDIYDNKFRTYASGSFLNDKYFFKIDIDGNINISYTEVLTIKTKKSDDLMAKLSVIKYLFFIKEFHNIGNVNLLENNELPFFVKKDNTINTSSILIIVNKVFKSAKIDLGDEFNIELPYIKNSDLYNLIVPAEDEYIRLHLDLKDSEKNQKLIEKASIFGILINPSEFKKLPIKFPMIKKVKLTAEAIVMLKLLGQDKFLNVEDVRDEYPEGRGH